MALFLFLTIQCSWTPEIETLIHQSPKGRVALETSKLFTLLPNHPHTFTESLLKNILKEFSQIQEKGILQELFFSSSTSLPVFSSTQIDFLVPHLAQAISRATPDELVTFQCAGENEDIVPVDGTISIFSPTIMVLTLKNSRNHPIKASKTSTSSKNLQRTTRILYSNKEAILSTEAAQRFMKFSQTDSWIAINYSTKPSKEALSEEEALFPPTIDYLEKENSSDIEILQKQLLNLQKKVDEQAEEIRQLQTTDSQ